MMPELVSKVNKCMQSINGVRDPCCPLEFHSTTSTFWVLSRMRLSGLAHCFRACSGQW